MLCDKKTMYDCGLGYRDVNKIMRAIISYSKTVVEVEINYTYLKISYKGVEFNPRGKVGLANKLDGKGLKVINSTEYSYYFDGIMQHYEVSMNFPYYKKFELKIEDSQQFLDMTAALIIPVEDMLELEELNSVEKVDEVFWFTHELLLNIFSYSEKWFIELNTGYVAVKNSLGIEVIKLAV